MGALNFSLDPYTVGDGAMEFLGQRRIYVHFRAGANAAGAE